MEKLRLVLSSNHGGDIALEWKEHEHMYEEIGRYSRRDEVDMQDIDIELCNAIVDVDIEQFLLAIILR